MIVWITESFMFSLNKNGNKLKKNPPSGCNYKYLLLEIKPEIKPVISLFKLCNSKIILNNVYFTINTLWNMEKEREKSLILVTLINEQSNLKDF